MKTQLQNEMRSAGCALLTAVYWTVIAAAVTGIMVAAALVMAVCLIGEVVVQPQAAVACELRIDSEIEIVEVTTGDGEWDAVAETEIKMLPPPAANEKPDSREVPDMAACRYVDLNAMAKDLRIPRYSRMSKEQLWNALYC